MKIEILNNKKLFYILMYVILFFCIVMDAHSIIDENKKHKLYHNLYSYLKLKFMIIEKKFQRNKGIDCTIHL